MPGSPSWRRSLPMLPSQVDPPVFRLAPTTQMYDWGKLGLSSKVAQLAMASSIPGFCLNESATYAELWMGTHSSSPSRVLASSCSLSAHLAARPNLMGVTVTEKFQASDGNLPFLFKVLSIQKALSIQTHPDKLTAEKLHRELPHVYKDSNHKPEMAIALTPFTALCGFLPLARIDSYLQSTPEFCSLIPTPVLSAFHKILPPLSGLPCSPIHKAALKALFSAVMTAPPDQVHANLSALVKRYSSSESIIHDTERPIVDLVLTLDSQFPGDVGVFCVFLLNYIVLKPGEAIFLGAGEPHAYVSGDIMECMANSDNVIRAGLTPKLRDIPNLIAGLTYAAADPEEHVVKPTPYLSTTHTQLYDPPISEFSVLLTQLDPHKSESHEAIDGPSICIVTEGAGVVRWTGQDAEEMRLGTGDVFFIGAGRDVRFDTLDDDEQGLTVFRALVTVDT